MPRHSYKVTSHSEGLTASARVVTAWNQNNAVLFAIGLEYPDPTARVVWTVEHQHKDCPACQETGQG